MRIALLVGTVAIAAMAPYLGYARSMTASPALQTEEQRVLATEDDYVLAEVNRDEPTLRRMIDDRFVFNSSGGTTSNKEELIQNILKMAMVGQTLRERP
jgi:hypothetical protein